MGRDEQSLWSSVPKEKTLLGVVLPKGEDPWRRRTPSCTLLSLPKKTG